MPQVIDVHLNGLLRDISIAFPQGNLISPRLLAEIPVRKQTDEYPLYDTARRGEAPSNDTRSPGATANELKYDVETASYACKDHANKEEVTDELVANADDPFDPFGDAANNVTKRIMVNQEIDLKTIMDAGITQTAAAGSGTGWNQDGGTPISDINTGINAIEDATTFTPNVLAMDSKVWRALRNNPEIVERVLAGGGNENPANISTGGVAELFGLEEILISTASKNAAVKGQNVSLSRVWGLVAYLVYRPTGPSLKTPAFGYRFRWTLGPGGREGFNAFSWRDADESMKKWWVAIEKYYDQKITLPNAGYKITATIT